MTLTLNGTPTRAFYTDDGWKDRGEIRVYTGTDPALGVEISETVPAGKMWRLLGLVATFITDATVISRTPALAFDDGNSARQFLRAPSSISKPASNTDVFLWLTMKTSSYAQAGIFIAIPDIPLPAGFRVRTSTTNLQAGDNWSAPVLYVVESSL